MKLLPALGALVLLLMVTSCSKDSSSKKEYITALSEIDGYVNDYMKKYNRLGLAAAIVKGDQLIWSKGYGSAIKELNLNASDETVYFTASFSKTVVAVAALQLIEDGKLDINKDINTYLDFKVKNPNSPAKAITTKHLLTHTSTIIDAHYGELVIENIPAFYFDEANPDLSLAEICKAFLSTDGKYYNINTFSNKTIGAANSYSYGNIATTLLAYIVERVSAKPFSQYTQEKIFDPLCMTKTSWSISSFKPTEMAYMYQSDGTPWGNYTNLLWPASSMRSTVKDMSIYLRAIGLGGTFNGREILKSFTVDDMLTKKVNIPGSKELQMGYIWGVESIMGNHKNLIGYIGESEGSETYMWYDRSTQTGAVILLNQDYKNPEDANSLQDFIANLLSVAKNIR